MNEFGPDKQIEPAEAISESAGTRQDKPKGSYRDLGIFHHRKATSSFRARAKAAAPATDTSFFLLSRQGAWRGGSASFVHVEASQDSPAL